MAMKTKRSSFRILLVCFLVCFPSVAPSRHSHKTYMNYANRVLNALEKVIGFFDDSYQDINLDGVFGLRVAEGAMKKTLEEEQSGVLHSDAKIHRRILLLKNKAGSAAEKAIPYLKKDSPKYFKEFKKTVIAPWPNFKPFQKLDHNVMPMPALQKKDFIEFDEHRSDHCLTEMSGTEKDNNSSKPCTISDECWKLETEGKTHGYGLTHQGLYLLLGEVQGCQKEISERLKQSNIKGGIGKVYSRMCATMYPQMVHIEKKDGGLYSNAEDRDLYMEQAMVCATMGFSDFLSIKRLDDILSWQMDKGCFGSVEELKNRRLQKVVDEELEMMRSKGDNREDMRVSRKLMSKMTMRKILIEKELKDGCMSHITGVATGVLGVYLRWLLHSASAFPTVVDPVFAQEREIDRVVEDIPVAPKHVQVGRMRRRSVLQDQQSPVKVLDHLPRQHGTNIPSWKTVLFVSFVLVWLVFSLRFQWLRRAYLLIVARRMKSCHQV